MYSTRFNGRPKNKGDHDRMDTAPGGPSPPLITALQAWQPKNIRRQKEKRRRRALASIITLCYIHLITHLEGGDHKVALTPLSRTAEPAARIARINEIA
jgi:hypothetical protein